MRDARRRIIGERPKGQLRRTADGRLRPANEEADIADVWAGLRRARLAAAIEADRHKTTRKHKRAVWRLFGRKTVINTPHAIQASHRASEAAKEIEIRVSLPRLAVGSYMAAARRWVHQRQVTKKQWLLAIVVTVLVVFALGTRGIYTNNGAGQGGGKTPKSTAHGMGAEQREQPDYNTILPVGKTIEQLGGWGRVSPPDKDPVFAYADTLNGVAITVSEQPLPAAFLASPEEHVASVAKQFNTTQQVIANDTTVYIGLSVKGPQSVIFTKDGLLVLIKSASKVPDDLWAVYVRSLE